MKILGIETSCDETSAAVVEDGVQVLSNVTLSSLKEHSHYGGIIPEIASRRQIELIYAIVDKALNTSRTGLKDLRAVAVTTTPGLMGSLLVGISFAKALAKAAGKPVINIDHVHAHLYANFLRSKGQMAVPLPKLPAVGLVVSGGHTSLYYVKSMKKPVLIGQTRDDAAGEAFDKVARILGLGYPGGPIIDRLSTQVKKTSLRFPRADLGASLDFSFSGVKTAVLYYVRQHEGKTGYRQPDVAAAFQQSVVDALVKNALDACRKNRCKTLLVGGGVAANSLLRKVLESTAATEGIKVHFPPIEFCLDNAAMIAGLGCVMGNGRR